MCHSRNTLGTNGFTISRDCSPIPMCCMITFHMTTRHSLEFQCVEWSFQVFHDSVDSHKVICLKSSTVSSSILVSYDHYGIRLGIYIKQYHKKSEIFVITMVTPYRISKHQLPRWCHNWEANQLEFMMPVAITKEFQGLYTFKRELTTLCLYKHNVK